ncbi:BatD family protein [Sulfurimonas hydrogeniphila]|uniref:BatD family protein n=1 Tax=Sulfurimonas hydrogeniphila TaxID=2509341 RepID=UPI00125F4738|nr:BatD family protein [Sulfurimonas hydrogeniphila]
MKNTLGKIFLLFILFTVSLFGAGQLATYKLTTNKKSVHIKEPLLITFQAEQKNHSDHMFFSFNVQKSPDYEVKLLQKSIQDKGYHNTKTTFKFILFALKAKTLHVNFDFIIRTASDKAVKQSYVDDHDDSIAISTYDTKIALKPLTLKVEKFKKHVDLVGDFKISSTIDTDEIDQYGIVNLHYILSGTGYKETALNILNTQIENVSIFSKRKDKLSRLTEDGYIINTEYIYALSASDNFTIPSFALEVYSPRKNSYYTLHTKAYKVKVKKTNPALLLDKTNAPQNQAWINFAQIKTFFIYTLIFLAGFFTAKISQKSFFTKKQKEEFADIKRAIDAKELLLLLIMNYQNRGLDEDIAKLEADIHEKHPLNLGKIKKEILKKLK